MKHYYLYITTANVFTSSGERQNRPDYFYIGKFENIKEFNLSLLKIVEQICIENTSTVEQLNEDTYYEITNAFNNANTPELLKGLLSQQLLFRSQLEFNLTQRSLS
jgi:hypothetical protein